MTLHEAPRALGAVTYDDRVTTSTPSPVVLRNGVVIEDPLGVVLGLLKAWRFDAGDPSRPVSFGEPDLRLANRGGARISAAEIAVILERRRPIEEALRAIAPGASLTGAPDAVPWLPLRQLFDAFAGIRGVGFSRMTKALHPKRPALIPMLDSIVQKYLQDDDPGAEAPFGARALGLVHGYKRDLDQNQAAVRAVRQELASRSYVLTDVRILDLLILSAEAAARPPRALRLRPPALISGLQPNDGAGGPSPRSSSPAMAAGARIRHASVTSSARRSPSTAASRSITSGHPS
jgi:Family of unknown function (DUF6308)